jgi:hypothetical protein
VFRVKSIYTGEQPAAQWSMTLGAFGLPGGMLPGGSLPVSAAANSPRGIAMSVVSDGPCTAALRRFRPDGVTAPVSPAAATKQAVHIQEANNQYATSVDVDGVGASGPPRERETA